MTTTVLPTRPLTPLEHFSPLSLEETPAAALRRLRAETAAFKAWFARQGRVDLLAARSLITLPYPRTYALWEACSLPVPYVWMTNRLMVVQWQEQGRTVTLLAEPSDYELGVETPYLRTAVERLPFSRERALDTLFVRHRTVVEHLADLGIAPEDVDWLVFDHLHTQDVRRLVGTTAPAPDLGFGDGPVPPLFPNATLIVHRTELEHVVDVHPFQARFHQPGTYADVDRTRLAVIDGDVLVGPGVALLHAPGHTLGNLTLAFNTPRGIFTSSENGVAVESWVPEHSRLRGVARWAAEQRMEVVLNFNTPEFASWQYNAMVREKLLADPVPSDPRWPQVLPSSELARHRLAPGIRPTFAHGDLTIGEATFRGAERPAGGQPAPADGRSRLGEVTP